MKTSDKTAEIIPALVAVQEDMVALKVAENPHFKSKYATLDCILATIKPALKEAGLTVLQSIDTHERRLVCTTTTYHVSGEWMESTVSLKVERGTPQGYGSAITYVRRYGLATALGIGLMDDDDGDMAEKETTKADAETERKNELAKAKGKVFDHLAKYDPEPISVAFEEHGYISEEPEIEDMLRDLINLVDSREKLINIGRRVKALQAEMDSTSENTELL